MEALGALEILWQDVLVVFCQVASTKAASDSEVAETLCRVQRTGVSDVWLLILEERLQVVRKLANISRASVST